MRPDFFVEMGPGVSSRSLACSKCKNVEGRVLPFSEQLRYPRWFFRCAVCGHVWTIDKKLQTNQQRWINQRSKSARKAFNAAWRRPKFALVIAKGVSPSVAVTLDRAESAQLDTTAAVIAAMSGYVRENKPDDPPAPARCAPVGTAPQQNSLLGLGKDERAMTSSLGLLDRDMMNRGLSIEPHDLSDGNRKGDIVTISAACVGSSSFLSWR